MQLKLLIDFASKFCKLSSTVCQTFGNGVGIKCNTGTSENIQILNKRANCQFCEMELAVSYKWHMIIVDAGKRTSSHKHKR